MREENFTEFACYTCWPLTGWPQRRNHHHHGNTLRNMAQIFLSITNTKAGCCWLYLNWLASLMGFDSSAWYFMSRLEDKNDFGQGSMQAKPREIKCHFMTGIFFTLIPISVQLNISLNVFICSRVLISSITYYITVSFFQKSKWDFFSLFENCVNLGERCATIFKSSQEYVWMMHLQLLIVLKRRGGGGRGGVLLREGGG